MDWLLFKEKKPSKSTNIYAYNAKNRLSLKPFFAFYSIRYDCIFPIPDNERYALEITHYIELPDVIDVIKEK